MLLRKSYHVCTLTTYLVIKCIHILIFLMHFDRLWCLAECSIDLHTDAIAIWPHFRSPFSRHILQRSLKNSHRFVSACSYSLRRGERVFTTVSWRMERYDMNAFLPQMPRILFHLWSLCPCTHLGNLYAAFWELLCLCSCLFVCMLASAHVHKKMIVYLKTFALWLHLERYYVNTGSFGAKCIFHNTITQGTGARHTRP